MSGAISTLHRQTESNDLYAVKDSDINAANGNYVFTVGNVSSGKSTLQNLFLYRLWTNEHIVFDYCHETADHRHDAILNGWIESFSKGIFPERTKANLLQNFSIAFGQNNRKSVKINFLEISGEDIKTIVPDLRGSKPKIHSQLEQFLRLRKLNKRFVFVSDCEKHTTGSTSESGLGEDILFSELLEHLQTPQGIGLKRLNILFVAAKWDMVQHQYTGGVQEYFNRHFPNTKAFTKRSGIEATFIPFSVGSVKMDSTDGKNPSLRIATLENQYADFLIQWIYHSYSGRTLTGFPSIVESNIKRVLSALRRFL